MVSKNLNDDEIITLLQQLFVNMNNLDRIYYDLFINETPMDITLERYNQDGVIETHVIPNRAKDRQNVLQGRGNPEGAYNASIGVLYFDILTNNVYIKITESGPSGWILLRTSANFIPGEDYLTPYGSASHLTDISASSLDGGILDVRVGGTGNTGLNGILKGKGENPIGTAVAGVDYVTPKTHIGMIGIFPGEIEQLPDGWLVANGALINKTDYPVLAERLGDKYLYQGTEWDRTKDPDYNIGKTALPDYRGYYLRGWNSTNSLNAPILIGDHESGALPNITGSFFNTQENETALDKNPYGAFYRSAQSGNGVDGSAGWFERLNFDARRCSTLYVDGMNEVRVNGVYVLYCIYAGARGEKYTDVVA